MAKLKNINFNDFVTKAKSNNIKQTISENSNLINFAARAAKTALSIARSKDYLDVTEKLLDLVESVSSNTGGNFFNSSHYDFIKDNKLVRVDLPLPSNFYTFIFDNLKSKTYSRDAWEQYTVYWIDDIIFTAPLDGRRKEFESLKGDSNSILVSEKNKDFVLNFLNENLINSFSKNLYFSHTDNSDNHYHGSSKFPVLSEKIYSNSIINPIYFNRVKKSLDKNIKRSYLFYGPPGSGKSTIVSSIVNELDLRSFTIKDLASTDLNELKQIFNVFNFEIVVIDDLDHQNSLGANSLEILEWLKTQVKLVLVTANIINGLNPALIRPGRIDEIIYIDSLPEEKVLEMISPHYFLLDKVKSMPAAYINEIMERIKLNGVDNIQEDIIDLQKRSESYILTFKKENSNE